MLEREGPAKTVLRPIRFPTQFVNAENSPFRRFLDWNRLSGPPDTDLWPNLHGRADAIVKKGTYTSVCKDLLDRLADNAVKSIHMAGIDTDCCVLKTASDLFELGIRPYVLAHYSASTGGHHSHEAGLTVLRRMIGADSVVEGEIGLDVAMKDEGDAHIARQN